MMDNHQFEPKIITLVCNWFTYLRANLTGMNRLEYPPGL